MMSRSQNVLPWPAKRAARCRCHGWMCAMPAAILVLLGCFQSAIGRAPASRPAPAMVPMPRVIRLISGAPYYLLAAQSRQRILRKAGNASFSASRRIVVQVVSPNPAARRAGTHTRTISAVVGYCKAAVSAFFNKVQGGLAYSAAVGNARRYFLYDGSLVSTVLVVAGTAGAKGQPNPRLPEWLSGRARLAARKWLGARYLFALPIYTFKGETPDRLAGPGRWGSAVVTFHPCQIVCYSGGRRKYLRLQFRRWSGAEKVPQLRSLRFWQTRQVGGLSAKMSWSFRTGRSAVPMPIHLTANGLKKLGFKVVYLTANTPAPAAELLTPADAAKIKIMRRRFEKWAGVWSRLHPGKHPH